MVIKVWSSKLASGQYLLRLPHPALYLLLYPVHIWYIFTLMTTLTPEQAAVLCSLCVLLDQRWFWHPPTTDALFRCNTPGNTRIDRFWTRGHRGKNRLRIALMSLVSRWAFLKSFSPPIQKRHLHRLNSLWVQTYLDRPFCWLHRPEINHNPWISVLLRGSYMLPAWSEAL